MIYIFSFFRRIKFKSAIYFSLLTCIPILFFINLSHFFFLFCSLVFIIQLISKIINIWDRSQITNMPCPMCSHEHSVLLYPARNKNNTKETGSYACSSFDHGTYPNIRFCPLCKNGFVENLIETNLDNFITKGQQLYKDVVDNTYLENIQSRYKTYKNITKKYSEHFKQKDILEVGSYYGVFIEEILKISSSYVGIEPSKHASEYTKNKYEGIEIINDNLENTLTQNLLKDKKFDTIVMWDVIEHLPNPINTLRKLNSLLKDNGCIIFSTINIESSFSMLLGPRWPWFMDMHYYYFSDRGYVDMLHRSGYVIKGHYHFKYFVYLSYFLQKVIRLIFNFEISNKSWILKLKTTIPIQLGDTVLVIGKKESKMKNK